MDHVAAPRVLLGNLDPIMVIGMARVLGEAGAEVIGREEHPAQIVAQSRDLRPDVVVLDFDDTSSRTLAERVRQASPETKVVLWARDEAVMEVLDPWSSTARLVAVAVPEGLRREMSSSRHGQRVEE